MIVYHHHVSMMRGVTRMLLVFLAGVLCTLSLTNVTRIEVFAYIFAVREAL
jgi:hypothetical protein